ncbi:hypothetical protein FM113_03745 [Leucobacter sp. 7(1)]|uniref:hypothetical protein n=1 Tax=Leucobacter sp. 7(1) TaxID=1255613 RepID=UPI00097E8358|nr:hypothetical protein [Leucobacter sp. 7(1)]SJN08655.1 hypothetical protein FM113_03745 [Leucobacter sp. 7(1)]
MLTELFNLTNLAGLILGLATGLTTGFFFERRATKEARRQNAATRESNAALRDYIAELEAQQRAGQHELQQTVQRVRESVYSSAAPTRATSATGTALTPEHLLSEIRRRLDVSGKTSLPSLFSGCAAAGHPRPEVESVLNALHDSGTIVITGKYVEFV